MNITPQEAQTALNDIRSATTKAHNVINIWAYYMLLWGIIWTLGFLASQVVPPLYIAWLWGIMVLLGMVGSAVIGTRQGRLMRTTPGTHTAFVGSRLGIFFGVLYGFAILWLILFPLTPMQVGMLWITVVMFGSIITGAWLREPVSIWLGVGVTITSVIGYYLVPLYFWIWVSVFAGSPLVAVSLYYLRKR